MRLIAPRIRRLCAESDQSVASRRRHKSAAAPDREDLSEGNESGEEAADSPPLYVFVSGGKSKQEMKDGDGEEKSRN